MVTAKRISRGNAAASDTGSESFSYGSEGRKMSVATIIATPGGAVPQIKKDSLLRRNASSKSSSKVATGANARTISSPPAAPSTIIYTQALMPNQYSRNTKLDPNRPTEAQYLLTLARRTARVSNQPGYG